MHYCTNCNKEFDEPRIEKTTYEDYFGVVNEFKNHHSMNLEKCPYCGSDEIEEMETCDNCGEYCLEHDLTDTSEMVGMGVGRVCPDCLIDMEA